MPERMPGFVVLPAEAVVAIALSHHPPVWLVQLVEENWKTIQKYK